MWHRQGFAQSRSRRPSTQTHTRPSAAHPQSAHPLSGVLLLVVAAFAAGVLVAVSLSIVIASSLALLAP